MTRRAMPSGTTSGSQRRSSVTLRRAGGGASRKGGSGCSCYLAAGRHRDPGVRVDDDQLEPPHRPELPMQLFDAPSQEAPERDLAAREAAASKQRSPEEPRPRGRGQGSARDMGECLDLGQEEALKRRVLEEPQVRKVGPPGFGGAAGASARQAAQPAPPHQRRVQECRELALRGLGEVADDVAGLLGLGDPPAHQLASGMERASHVDPRVLRHHLIGDAVRLDAPTVSQADLECSQARVHHAVAARGTEEEGVAHRGGESRCRLFLDHEHAMAALAHACRRYEARQRAAQHDRVPPTCPQSRGLSSQAEASHASPDSS
jgi:hypothetical protein